MARSMSGLLVSSASSPRSPQEEDPLHTGPAWVRNKTRVLAFAAAPLARAQAGETKAPKWVRK